MQMLQQVGELAWRAFQSVNTRLAEGPAVNPRWAPGALPKSHERTRPPLGYPRETDSLCPRCVIEARKRILSGERDLSDLVNGHLGEIKATFYQKGRELWVTKTCPDHGTFDDLRSIDIEFDHVIERRYPGRDFRTLGDALVHRHGTSTVRYGRGAVLTVDLTNRCNMMCNPCFMDANQVGYVHELTLDEVKKILDDSVSFKPRRQMVVQYSGASPRCRRTSSRPAPTRRRSATRWSRPRPTACASRSSPSSPSRRRRPGSTWSTSSSTGRRTSRTPTATSRTCSTSRRSRSTTWPRRGSASRRW